MDIKEGAGSGKTVSLMAGQQDDIGFADYMLMAAGVAKGMKLKGIYGGGAERCVGSDLAGRQPDQRPRRT